MAECNEVITKVVYNYDGEHESSNADSEEKSALEKSPSPSYACGHLLTCYH